MPSPLARLTSFVDRGSDLASVLRGAGVVLAIRIAGAGLTYLSLVFIARWLGPYQFGIYAYATGWALLLSLPATLGLPSAVLRFLPEYLSQERWSRAAGLIRGAPAYVAAAGVAIGLCGVLVVLGFSDGIAPHYVTPLIVAFATVPLLALIHLIRDLARSLGLAGLAFGPRGLAHPLMIIAMVGLLWVSGANPTAVAVLAVIFASLLAIVLGQRQAVISRLPQPVRSSRPKTVSRDWLRVSFPMFLTSGFAILLNKTDVLMLGAYATPEDIAVYAAAAQTAGVILTPLGAVLALAVPKFAVLNGQGRRGELQTLVSGIIHWIFWPSLLGVTAFILFGAEILSLFGATFAVGSTALAILALGHLVSASTAPAAPLLNMTGHQNAVAWVFGCSAAINIILNTLLIPRFGIVGAASATAISTVLCNVWPFILARRRLKIHCFLLGRPRASANAS